MFSVRAKTKEYRFLQLRNAAQEFQLDFTLPHLRLLNVRLASFLNLSLQLPIILRDGEKNEKDLTGYAEVTMLKTTNSFSKTISTILFSALIGAGVMFGLKALSSSNSDSGNSRLTIERIETISELATVRFYLSNIVEYEQPKDWYDVKEVKVLVLAKGSIQGRVDLKPDDWTIDREKRTVEIKIEPESIKIGDPEISPDDGLNTWIISEGLIFNKLKEDERKKATTKALKELKQTAIDLGIREHTAAEAKKILERVLESLGYQANIIIIRE